MIETIFFSPRTGGAYWLHINGHDIPDDVIEYPLSDWELLLMELGQSPKKLVAGTDGLPVLIDPPQPDNEQLEITERAWRDSELLSTDAMIARHRDELEGRVDTTLTDDQYAELQRYRRYLRDWPQGDDFPLAEHRPKAPAWLFMQTQ